MVNVEGSLSADLIAQQNFGAARRGFDPDEVRAFLVKVAAEIVALHQRQEALESARRDAEYRAAHPSFDEDTLLGAVGDETAHILKSAHEAAGDTKARAEENASRILKEAHQQADGLRGEAETVLARRTEEAEAVAGRIKEAARAESERLVDQARQQSKAIRAQAEAERTAMIEGAQVTRERILSALSKKRNVAVAQVEALRAGRERLLEAYQIVRETLDEASSELARAESEARAAAAAVRHRPLGLDDPDGLGTEDEPTNPTLPIIRRLRPGEDPAAPPLATRAGAPRVSAAPAAAPAPAPARAAAAPAPAPARAAAAPAPAPARAAAAPAPASSPAPAPAATAPAPASSPAPAPAATAPAATSSPAAAAPSAPAEASSAGPAPASASAGRAGLAAAPPAPGPMGEGAAAPAGSAPTVAASAPVTPGPASTGAPAASSAAASGGPAPAPVTAASAASVPTPRAPEGAPRADAAPTKAPADGPGTGAVESLFARIRADRDRAVSQAREVLADDVQPPAEPVVAERPVPDTDEALLQRRDEVVGPIEANLTRRLKRALQDDQNDLLDRLRGLRSSQKASAVVLPERDAHAARFRDVGRPFLSEAGAAGVAFATTLVPGGRATESLGGLDQWADDMTDAIVDPLRRRLEDVLMAGEGDDPVVLAEAVGAAYREWKTKRVEVVASDHVAAAFAQGAFAATPNDAQLRWLVDDPDGPCPDCDDNVLAGDLPKGEPFPTGQRHPPAHPGCRCLLVPGQR